MVKTTEITDELVRTLLGQFGMLPIIAINPTPEEIALTERLKAEHGDRIVVISDGDALDPDALLEQIQDMLLQDSAPGVMDDYDHDEEDERMKYTDFDDDFEDDDYEDDSDLDEEAHLDTYLMDEQAELAKPMSALDKAIAEETAKARPDSDPAEQNKEEEEDPRGEILARALDQSRQE